MQVHPLSKTRPGKPLIEPYALHDPKCMQSNSLFDVLVIFNSWGREHKISTSAAIHPTQNKAPQKPTQTQPIPQSIDSVVPEYGPLIRNADNPPPTKTGAHTSDPFEEGKGPYTKSFGVKDSFSGPDLGLLRLLAKAPVSTLKNSRCWI